MAQESVYPRQVKASFLRGSITVLERMGLMAAVRPRVSAGVRRMLEDPPPNSAWIDGRVQDEIYAAVAALRGRETLRRLAREAVSSGVIPLMRSVIEGFL